MGGIHEQGSEVVRLLRRIGAEYEAAQQALSGLAQGVSQHRVITQHMERVHGLHAQLHALVGEEAIALIAAHLEQAEQGAADRAPPRNEPARAHHPET